VTNDCLKLTTYFGERDRTAHHLLADELLALYGAHQIETSVLLRGVSGFGLKHHLHTDQLLSMSEDLPLVSVAVDSRERIDALLPQVMAIQRRGLVTLERARMVTADSTASEPAHELNEVTKLTVYVGRKERFDGTEAFRAVCDLLYRRGLAGATVLLGVDGTHHGLRKRASLLGRNGNVPMMITSVGAGEQILSVLPELAALDPRPTLTLERVRLCKRDGELLTEPDELPGVDDHGLGIWQKLMVHSSENARFEGKPLHRALVTRLRAANVAGATSLRGVWGFHGDHAPHGDKLLQLHRHVPVVTIVIDRPERIAKAFGVIDEMTQQRGLVTSEIVPAATAMSDQTTTGGVRLARHRFETPGSPDIDL
jgi:PII-like signaling protein